MSPVVNTPCPFAQDILSRQVKHFQQGFMLLAVLLLGDRLTLGRGLGGALIVLGVFLIQRFNYQKKVGTMLLALN